jgi:class 3 adenylate cyclase
MQEPPIQYTKTKDGMNIAFWTMGEGPPLVLTSPMNWSHIERELKFPRAREWYERLAQDWQVLRFDSRGHGMSDRRVRGFDLLAVSDDIEAVANAAGFESFALFGCFVWGPAAIAYAAMRPERVSHLVLWGTEHVFRQAGATREQMELISKFSQRDWQLWTENMGAISLGWERGREAHELAEFIRASVSQEFVASYRDKMDNDAATYLSDVHCPVLVLHARDNPILSLDRVGVLASSIPGSRLRVLNGRSIIPHGRVAEDVAEALLEFSGRLVPSRRSSQEALPSGTAVILFADIVDSTALTERLGDAAFRGKARELDGALRGVIREHAGTTIEGKLLGDGVLAVFTSARQAIEAALACGRAGDDAGLPLHLGLHAGDVLREKDAGNRDNVYGGAVNIASRISGLSAAGEVLVSETVRSLARTSAGVTFEDRGEQALKGVGEPVRVWAVMEGE